MKLIVDIPEEVVKAIQNGKDYRYDIHTAIAQGIPYEQRSQGEWIEDYTKECHSFLGWHCNLCNTGALEINEYPYASKFCPNCGAKMINGGTNE